MYSIYYRNVLQENSGVLRGEEKLLFAGEGEEKVPKWTFSGTLIYIILFITLYLHYSLLYNYYLTLVGKINYSIQKEI